MNKYIVNRVLNEAKYMIDTGDTVRGVALIFNVSKSTVHKDLHDRLLEIDFKMYNEVSKVLKYHSEVRHIRGGDATRRKFLEKNVI